jgi:hypothetical protein
MAGAGEAEQADREERKKGERQSGRSVKRKGKREMKRVTKYQGTNRQTQKKGQPRKKHNETIKVKWRGEEGEKAKR